MADLSTTEVSSRTITAFFDSREAAQKATDDLIAAGIPREHIRLTEGSGTSTLTEAPKATGDKSFWDELKDLFIPDEDRYGYAEGLRRGGYLLSIRVEEAYYTRVMEILDTDGAVDMDEREASWRSSGWTGYQAGSAVGSRTTAAADMGLAAASAATNAPVGRLDGGRDEVITLYEESAQVAKRDVNHGRVRLRSYVVETPITEQVNLRNESIEIERRPVDRAIAVGDDVFKDRVIEAEEHVEEAFITKETRVKEEISLRKTVDTRVQTVSDTVRRTEVEIDDQREKVGLAAVGLETAVDAKRILEHMDVIAADGIKIGTVDHMDGPDTIKLAKSTSPDGEHHYVPLGWVDHIDAHVHLKKSSAETKSAW